MYRRLSSLRLFAILIRSRLDSLLYISEFTDRLSCYFKFKIGQS
jgi:hypothetical protein